MKLETTEIHEVRELKKDPKKFSYNRFFKGEKLPEFSLLGRRTWLKINPSGKIEKVVKTLEWKFGLDVDYYAEAFVISSLSGDFSKLPEIVNIDGPRHPEPIGYAGASSHSFAINVLGLAAEELDSLDSLVLTGVDGGWEYDFFLCSSRCHWTNCDLKSKN